MTVRNMQCRDIVEPFRSELIHKMTVDFVDLERKVWRLLRKDITIRQQKDLLNAFRRYQQSRNAFLMNPQRDYSEWRKDYLFRRFDVTSKIRFLEFLIKQKGGDLK